ncbi:LEM domain-containing protein 2-like isoform X1 [Chiloscyllium plagiosum]|uniref:LEM domain-containing protein 2-like isoform X1 n=1 Tax=Chiloscyllium plagiosum TaxID=36176 RepID=UPI001CB80D55|nr:LEM domain-containing protein 2-like isoform X1 [Chiloscyllium plagiosum]
MATTMSDRDLRSKLKALGFAAGPITDSTRSVYLKKLQQLQSEKNQQEKNSRAPRVRQSLRQREVEFPAPAPAPEQPRRKPAAVSNVRAESSRQQADAVSDSTTIHYSGTSAAYLTNRLHSGDDEDAEESDSLSSHRYTGTSSSLHSDSFTRKPVNSYSDRYTGASGSLTLDPYTTKSVSSYSDRYTGASGSLTLDPYTTKSVSSYSDRYTGASGSLTSDPYTRKPVSSYSERYTGISGSLTSDPYTRKPVSSYSERYTGVSGSLGSDPYAGTSGGLTSESHSRITDRLYSDRYTGESLNSDPYTKKSDSSYSDPYTRKSDSLYPDTYTEKSDILSSDQYARKYQSLKSKPYTRKPDSVYSDQHAGKSESLSSDLHTGRFSSLYSDQFSRNLGSLHSDSRYRGKSDSLLKSERYIRGTAAGLPKKGVQKPKNRLDKFEFYLSWFLYVTTIVLCLILLGLICVKTLQLLEESEDVGENIKMLPVDCNGKTDAYCQAEERKIIMLMLSEMYEYLAEIAGEFECGSEYLLKTKCVPVADVQRHLATNNIPNLEKFNEALQWIIQSTRDFGIRLVGEDSETSVTSVDQVICLESTRPQMNLYCRLRHAVYTILHRMLIFILVLSLLWIMLLLLKYQLKKMKDREQAVYEMVNKIIAVVRAHNQDWEKDLELIPYVPVPHVRDTLIQPENRKKMKMIWEKAVQFLEANESRIRTETQIINGEDFLVWRWTQPSSLCDSM